MGKIGTIIRFKNDTLCKALERSGMTQNDLAKKVGVYPVVISNIGNFKKFPREEMRLRICSALLVSYDDLFGQYEMFVEKRSRKELFNGVIKSMDMPRLLRYSDTLPLNSEEEIEGGERARMVEIALSKLDPREQKILLSYFGINEEKKELREIALSFHVSKSRIGEIKDRAIKKLKNHHQYLRDYL